MKNNIQPTDIKTIGNRVKEERKKRKWSQKDLAKMIGVSQATISEIERGIIKSTGLAVPLAKALKVDAVYFSDGKTSVIYKEQGTSIEGEIATSDSILITPYDFNAIYSDDIDSNDIQPNDAISFSHNLLKTYKLHKTHLLVVMRAKGNAMSPTIEDDETLILDMLDNKPKNSKVYLICLNNTLFIKRFLFTPKGWLLRSDNFDKSTYPDFEFSAEEINDIDIQGCIVWRGGIL